jgi:hypothetical protein
MEIVWTTVETEMWFIVGFGKLKVRGWNDSHVLYIVLGCAVGRKVLETSAVK